MIQQIGRANETPVGTVTENGTELTMDGGSVDQPTNKQDTSYAKVTFSQSVPFIYKTYECTKYQTQTGTTTYILEE